MSPKLPHKLRKFDLEYEKRIKKEILNELTQSQAGALDKFLIKEPQICVENSNVDNINLRNFEELVSAETMEDNIHFDAAKIHHLDAKNVDSVNDNCENIFDPRIWDSLESKMIDLLALKDPKRDFYIMKGPKYKSSRCFITNLYTRVLSNAEKCDRD